MRSAACNRTHQAIGRRQDDVSDRNLFPGTKGGEVDRTRSPEVSLRDELGTVPSWNLQTHAAIGGTPSTAQLLSISEPLHLPGLQLIAAERAPSLVDQTRSHETGVLQRSRARARSRLLLEIRSGDPFLPFQ